MGALEKPRRRAPEIGLSGLLTAGAADRLTARWARGLLAQVADAIAPGLEFGVEREPLKVAREHRHELVVRGDPVVEKNLVVPTVGVREPERPGAGHHFHSGDSSTRMVWPTSAS